MIQKTVPIRRWKQWLALPLAASLLLAVACERHKGAVAPADTPTSAVTRDAQASPPPPKLAPQSAESMPAPPAVYTYVEQMPQLRPDGTVADIVSAIQANLVYPKLASRKQGVVFASFIVTAKGDVESPNIMKGLSAEYDAAVLAAVQKLPRFIPGVKDGRAVAVSFTVPIQFAP